MTKKGVIRCLMALLLVAYIGVAVVMANQQSARDKCRGFDIRILQNDGSRDFVTQTEVRRLLKEWSLDDTDKPASAINLQKIEDKLAGVVNIEDAMVERMPDNTIRLMTGVEFPMTFTDKGNGHKVTVDADESFTNGVLWQQDAENFVCMEPWNGWANSVNEEGKHEVLDVDEAMTSEWSITIEKV